MKPIPLYPNLPTPTTTFGNPTPIAQYYVCPHCNNQSPLVKEWVGLTDEDKESFWRADQMTGKEWDELFDEVENKLRSKNT